MSKVIKTDAEWRAQLSPEAYRVTRCAGTERPFTGEHNLRKDVGTYLCVCCQTPLFKSDSKFDSGCGWPSFFAPLDGAHLEEFSIRAMGWYVRRFGARRVMHT